MDIVSLSSYLASSDSDYDRSPRCSATTNGNSADLSSKAAYNYGEKARQAIEAGEHLADQLVKERKFTTEQVSGMNKSRVK